MGEVGKTEQKSQDYQHKTSHAAKKSPEAESIAVTRGYFMGSKFDLIIIDPKYNTVMVYAAPQKRNHSFVTRTLEFIRSRYYDYPDIKIQAVINGTFFNNTPGGDNQPLGNLIYLAGEFKRTPQIKSYNGKPVYKLKRMFFGIKEDGTPVIRQSRQERAEQLAKEGFVELIGGGGPLIKDGKIIVSPQTLKEAGFRPQIHQMNIPRRRTCIGINKEGKILMCVFEGKGISLPDLAKFMINNGVKDAMFLDSGGSTGLCLQSEGVVCKSRAQSTFLYVVSKKDAKKIKNLELQKMAEKHKKNRVTGLDD